MTNPKQYKTEAIILGTRPLGEKDKLVSIFTPHLGRFTIVAKSAQSQKSKLRGCIEPTAKVMLELYKGKSLDLVTEGQLLSGYWGIRESFERLCLAGEFIRWIIKFTAEHQENNALFILLDQALSSLDQEMALQAAKRCFQTKLLQIEGLWDHDNWVTEQEFLQKIRAY